jgi:hypothetical protein
MLDLTPLAGKKIVLELSADPGSKRNPSFDWARWVEPRVQQRYEQKGATISVAGKPRWATAMSGPHRCKVIDKPDRQSIEMDLPGGVCLARGVAAEAVLPVDLVKARPSVLLLDSSGRQMTSAEYAGVHPASVAVGGQTRSGLRTHPPDHGQTIAQYVMRLPERPAVLRASVGIADGSHSTGVIFAVEANGQTLCQKHMLPGRWEDLTVSLKPFAGQPVVLSLVTDSDGPFNFDWACWATPHIEAQSP